MPLFFGALIIYNSLVPNAPSSDCYWGLYPYSSEIRL